MKYKLKNIFTMRICQLRLKGLDGRISSLTYINFSSYNKSIKYDNDLSLKHMNIFNNPRIEKYLY